ncbi:sphingosine 1-phosphate receptor 1-like [Hemiscyllium ocellatum]|uniref:sphingosine 1-phosphate receptor 1-like n=1 Tax=Hemiscyllium ocellatum TaxID=170820 RepID=UPI00296759A3|nr:sphingosine 1-phosphate receptor 1-like [Hemiscyllium ocellatum]
MDGGHTAVDIILSPRFSEYYSNETVALHYNYTGKLTSSRYHTGLRVHAIMFIIVCLFIILENLLVLIAIWKNSKFHKPMYYLLANLTLSDMLAGVAYMVNILLSGANTLKLTPVLWFLREGGVFITLTASVFSLLAIAVERHVTMVRMQLYHTDKKCRTRLFVAADWIISVFLGSLPIMGWNCIRNLSECSTVLPLYSKNYILVCILIFILILFAIVILYVRIYRLVKCNSPMGGTSRNMVSRSQKYLALLKTVTIVVGTFIACWLPLFIVLLLDVSYTVGTCRILYKADYFLGLAMINSALNPIIYTLTSRDMRRAIVRLLCLTKDGEQARCCGILVSECSTSQMDRSSHRHEPLHTTLSSGNGPQSPTRTSVA